MFITDLAHINSKEDPISLTGVLHKDGVVVVVVEEEITPTISGMHQISGIR